jgi:hypothetical protein
MINGFRTILRGKIGFENTQPPLPHSEHASTALKGAEFGRVGRLMFVLPLGWELDPPWQTPHKTSLYNILQCAWSIGCIKGRRRHLRPSDAGDYNI